MGTTSLRKPVPQTERRCPHCADDRVQRWGKSGGAQRYRCRNCRRTFNALTGTAWARLRNAELWVDYRAAVVEQLSNREAAEICGINPSTASRWRRRFGAATAPEPAPEAAQTLLAGKEAAVGGPGVRGASRVDFVDWARTARAEKGGGATRRRFDGLFRKKERD